jgi:hypothetical protein
LSQQKVTQVINAKRYLETIFAEAPQTSHTCVIDQEVQGQIELIKKLCALSD